MVELLTDPATWISFTTLLFLEVVLGIDNIVFIAVLVDRLPPEQRERARRFGITLALVTRLLLLFTLAWIIGLTAPLFMVWDHPVSWRDLILIGGGLFLLAKATSEIHDRIEGDELKKNAASSGGAMIMIITQIAVLDIVFSLDSVITAVGMVNEIEIMSAAVIAAVGIMLWASGPVSAFVSNHPTVKMLAFSFLLLVGMTLVADGLGFHIPKGYIYFAIGFSILVETLNLLVPRRQKETPE